MSDLLNDYSALVFGKGDLLTASLIKELNFAS